MPDVPPNSSTTTIMCNLCRRICLSAVIADMLSGMNATGSIKLDTLVPGRSIRSDVCSSFSAYLSNSRVSTTPTISSTVSAAPFAHNNPNVGWSMGKLGVEHCA